jgi:hypothetical protein
LKSGKLIRIYIPNFSVGNQPLGFDLTVELIKIFSQSRPEKELIVNETIPYARHYSQNLLFEKLFPLTVEKYLTQKLNVEKEKAKAMLADLGIEATRQLNRISCTENKYLTIRGLFCTKKALLVDYYGLDAMSIGLIDGLIKTELGKGNCAIGFDNLQYMEQSEPFENVERLIIKQTAPTTTGHVLTPNLTRRQCRLTALLPHKATVHGPLAEIYCIEMQPSKQTMGHSENQ